jgi:molybdenum cofactor biosynthesis enzyme MoaA
LTLAQISSALRALAGLGVRSVKLSGGEPTVRGDLPDVIYAIRECDMHSVTTTNGIRIRPAVFDATATCGAEFKFSIHRPHRANDEVLGVKSFDSIRANMATCVNRGIRFGINTVVTAHSTDFMDSMVQFAAMHGAWKISFIPIIPRGLAASGEGKLADHRLQHIRNRAAQLSAHYAGALAVRCIDIRSRDYWVIENDGSVWIEREADDLDIRVGDLADLLSATTSA